MKNVSGYVCKAAICDRTLRGVSLRVRDDTLYVEGSKPYVNSSKANFALLLATDLA
jgi:hypothetical protein